MLDFSHWECQDHRVHGDIWDGITHEELTRIDACGRGGDIPKATNRSAGEYRDEKAYGSLSDHKCSNYVCGNGKSTGWEYRAVEEQYRDLYKRETDTVEYLRCERSLGGS